MLADLTTWFQSSIAVIGLAITAAGAVFGGVQVILQARSNQSSRERPPQAPSAPAPADVFQRVLDTRTLRVGYVHYPPFSAMPMERGAETGGLYIDMLRELCARNGITPLFEQIKFSRAVSDVRDGSYDAVVSIFETPRRTKVVDFCAFMHRVAVSAVVKQSEDRIHSEADLRLLEDLRFVVCTEEIGHEIVEDQLKIPSARFTDVNTSNVSDILAMVADRKSGFDIAVADGLSCQYGLDARGLEGPRLKPIFRRHPLYLCPNGIMIGRSQPRLAAFFDKGMKGLLREERFSQRETEILDRYIGVIFKM